MIVECDNNDEDIDAKSRDNRFVSYYFIVCGLISANGRYLKQRVDTLNKRLILETIIYLVIRALCIHNADILFMMIT